MRKSASLAVLALIAITSSGTAFAGKKTSWKPYGEARAAAAKQGYKRYLKACLSQKKPNVDCKCRALNYALTLLTGRHVNKPKCGSTDYLTFRLALRNLLAGKAAKGMALLGSIVVAGVPGPGVKGAPLTQAAGEAVKGANTVNGLR